MDTILYLLIPQDLDVVGQGDLYIERVREKP